MWSGRDPSGESTILPWPGHGYRSVIGLRSIKAALGSLAPADEVGRLSVGRQDHDGLAHFLALGPVQTYDADFVRANVEVEHDGRHHASFHTQMFDAYALPACKGHHLKRCRARIVPNQNVDCRKVVNVAGRPLYLATRWASALPTRAIAACALSSGK